MYEYKNRFYAEDIRSGGEWVLVDFVSPAVFVRPLNDDVRGFGRKLTQRPLDVCPACAGFKVESTVWLGSVKCSVCSGTGKRK